MEWRKAGVADLWWQMILSMPKTHTYNFTTLRKFQEQVCILPAYVGYYVCMSRQACFGLSWLSWWHTISNVARWWLYILFLHHIGVSRIEFYELLPIESRYIYEIPDHSRWWLWYLIPQPQDLSQEELNWMLILIKDELAYKPEYTSPKEQLQLIHF